MQKLIVLKPMYEIEERYYVLDSDDKLTISDYRVEFEVY